MLLNYCVFQRYQECTAELRDIYEDKDGYEFECIAVKLYCFLTIIIFNYIDGSVRKGCILNKVYLGKMRILSLQVQIFRITFYCIMLPFKIYKMEISFLG